MMLWLSLPDEPYLRAVHVGILLNCVFILAGSLVYLRDKGRTRLLSIGVRVPLIILGIGILVPFGIGGLQDLLHYPCSFAGGEVSCVTVGLAITSFSLLSPVVFWPLAVGLPILLSLGIWKATRH